MSKHISNKTLNKINLEFYDEQKYVVCKYLVPVGYPVKKTNDFEIILPNIYDSSMKDVVLGSVKEQNDILLATSSRTLVVCKTSKKSLQHAENQCDVILERLCLLNCESNNNLLYYRKKIVNDYFNSLLKEDL